MLGMNTHQVLAAVLLVTASIANADDAPGCPDVPPGACSICGDGLCVGKPDAIAYLGIGDPVKCGTFQLQGLEGGIPLGQCPLLPKLIAKVCECGTTGAPLPEGASLKSKSMKKEKAPKSPPNLDATRPPTSAPTESHNPTPAPTESQNPTPGPTETHHPTYQTKATKAPIATKKEKTTKKKKVKSYYSYYSYYSYSESHDGDSYDRSDTPTPVPITPGGNGLPIDNPTGDDD